MTFTLAYKFLKTVLLFAICVFSACGCTKKCVLVYDMTTGRKYELDFGTDGYREKPLKIDKSGNFYFSVAREADKTYFIKRNITDGKMACKDQTPEPLYVYYDRRAIDISDDGRYLIYARLDHSIGIYDTDKKNVETFISFKRDLGVNEPLVEELFFVDKTTIMLGITDVSQKNNGTSVFILDMGSRKIRKIAESSHLFINKASKNERFVVFLDEKIPSDETCIYAYDIKKQSVGAVGKINAVNCTFAVEMNKVYVTCGKKLYSYDLESGCELGCNYMNIGVDWNIYSMYSVGYDRIAIVYYKKTNMSIPLSYMTYQKMRR